MSIHNMGKQTVLRQELVRGPQLHLTLFHGGDCGVAAKNATRLLQPRTSHWLSLPWVEK